MIIGISQDNMTAIEYDMTALPIIFQAICKGSEEYELRVHKLPVQ